MSRTKVIWIVILLPLLLINIILFSFAYKAKDSKHVKNTTESIIRNSSQSASSNEFDSLSDIETTTLIDSTTTSECSKMLWVEDGFCDDETNTELCDFDGGDCCMDQIIDNYCLECLCHETGEKQLVQPLGMPS